MLCLILQLAIAAAQPGTLNGYVFREIDGNPPRRPLTVELADGGRTRYRETTGAGGAFAFHKVQEGRYTIRARFGDFIVVEDPITVTSGGRNFAAVMLPKRRAGARNFRAVTADQLASQSNHRLQQDLRKAAALVAKHDLAGAARVYEQAAAEGATAELWDTLGLLYLQMGKKNESIRAFEKAISRDSEYLFPYAHLGWFYAESRQYRELLALANSALAADPQWMTAHALLGEAKAGTGDSAAAQRSAEKASALVQGRAAGPYLLIAKIRYVYRDCEGAGRYAARFLELNTSARNLPSTAKLLELLKACGPVP